MRYFRLFWVVNRKKIQNFDMYYPLKFCQCVSLVRDFALPEKTKVFIHLTWLFSIWDWEMKLDCKELDILPSCVRSPWCLLFECTCSTIRFANGYENWQVPTFFFKLEWGQWLRIAATCESGEKSKKKPKEDEKDMCEPSNTLNRGVVIKWVGIEIWYILGF